MRYISTGKAAELCSVTPDTILKWIKSGKLPARRTAGGHHRIPLESLEEFLSDAGEGLATAPAHSGSRFCWEYHSRGEEVREACQQCLVYRARALRCFEMSTLSKEAGFCGVFCKTSCEMCDYFQLHQRPARILVFTDDPELQQALLQDNDERRFILRFTSLEYEFSTLMHRFHPDYAVVDCSHSWEHGEELCRHIARDPQVPDVKIILAVAPTESPPKAETDLYPCLEKPFAFRQLAEQIEKLHRTGREA